MSQQTKVYRDQGGDREVFASGGTLKCEAGSLIGFGGATPVVQPTGANQAAIGAATYAAPDAVPAAITGGESPTEAEHNALRDAVASLRTQLVALAADVATHKTLLNQLRSDLVTLGVIKGSA